MKNTHSLTPFAELEEAVHLHCGLARALHDSSKAEAAVRLLLDKPRHTQRHALAAVKPEDEEGPLCCLISTDNDPLTHSLTQPLCVMMD